ncbi:uncharacterized protein LACBIDRAFT_299202 [Laccaria bicolor S238N-H82]|uniref:Predicted protein n=1 Tax=Laccaria bicolor (strain S238N-H82 / ATCC MYA-4686) TaxID=486041 RepID=B0E3N9_LACBS|nr:uncharacterized protein LACBIDRAFT_299202 [Laccaria bicolor S238N-H82]EDQ98539.1 predicted protein [Laccaria bicolor S238N-H82]|eukprot:XP_001890808.1 predicted protein [Laccaria bicolor S238N-H82]
MQTANDLQTTNNTQTASDTQTANDTQTTNNERVPNARVNANTTKPKLKPKAKSKPTTNKTDVGPTSPGCPTERTANRNQAEPGQGNEDVVMASPPKMKIPAYGSSRSTGGVIRGKAHGNTFNMGDADAVWDDMNVLSYNPAEKPVPGKIHTYISDLNPPEVDTSQSSFVTKVHDISKCQTIQDIVRHSSEDYSPIRSPAYRLFIHDEEDGWNIQGRYETIVGRQPKAEDYIEWPDKKTTYDPSHSLSVPGFAGHFGTTRGTRSLSAGTQSLSAHSGSHTGSRPGGSRADSHLISEQGSSKDHWLMGKTITPALRKRLIQELSINATFTNRSAPGLRFAWGRYQECTAAITKAREMLSTGNWPADLPPFTEFIVIEVFIWKSAWHANYVNTFLKIADEETEFPEMRDWLDSDPEQVHRSDTERIWGVRDQTKFTMEDLKTWVERGGTLKARRTSSPEEEEHSGKGKKKAQKSHKKLLNLVSVVLNFFDKCLVTLGYLALSIICTIFSLAIMGFSHAFVTLPLFMKLVIIVAILPFVSASPTTQPFPDIPFRDFSAFVEQTFAPKYH